MTFDVALLYMGEDTICKIKEILTYPEQEYAVNWHVLVFMDSMNTSCARLWLQDTAVVTPEIILNNLFYFP